MDFTVTSYVGAFAETVTGGKVGVVFLILLRRYFVVDLHGDLPFPESTATAEILKAICRFSRLRPTNLPGGSVDEEQVFAPLVSNHVFIVPNESLVLQKTAPGSCCASARPRWSPARSGC